MSERLVSYKTDTDEQTQDEHEVEVVSPGVDDADRWESDETNQQHSPELESLEVSIGTRGLGEYCRRHHRVEAIAVSTGHITLRRVMPDFDTQISY